MVLTLHCQVYNLITASDANSQRAKFREPTNAQRHAPNRDNCIKLFKLRTKMRLLSFETRRHRSITTFECLGLTHKFCMKLIQCPLRSTISDSNAGCAHQPENFHFVIHEIEGVAPVGDLVPRHIHADCRRRTSVGRIVLAHSCRGIQHRRRDIGRLLE